MLCLMLEDVPPFFIAQVNIRKMDHGFQEARHIGKIYFWRNLQSESLAVFCGDVGNLLVFGKGEPLVRQNVAPLTDQVSHNKDERSYGPKQKEDPAQAEWTQQRHLQRVFYGGQNFVRANYNASLEIQRCQKTDGTEKCEKERNLLTFVPPARYNGAEPAVFAAQ